MSTLRLKKFKATLADLISLDYRLKSIQAITGLLQLLVIALLVLREGQAHICGVKLGLPQRFGFHKYVVT